jgi:hypothetical protein
VREARTRVAFDDRGGKKSWCGSSKRLWLASAEGDDAPDGVVRRDTDGDSISGYNLDSEATHSAAQLGQHFVARVALHTVQAAAMDRHDRALHIDEIVLAQMASVPFRGCTKSLNWKG